MTTISRECSLYLSLDNSMQFLHYQALSGLGFNKLGLYEECIADPDNQYYLLQGTSQLFSPTTTFMSGLCFNRACSASDLEYALAAIQEYLPDHLFQALRIETPSLIGQDYDATTIVVLTLLSLLVAVFLVCSVVDLVKRRQGRRAVATGLREAFSVVTVVRLLESRSQRNNERVKTFSGVKAASLIGIALTNVATIAYFAPTTSFYEQRQDEAFYACFYTVDVWLMTSGFFLSYIVLKQQQKGDRASARAVLIKIVRRFLRLWPLYLVCLLLNWYVLPLVGNGPIWPVLIDFPDKFCSTFIPHLFMVSNLTADSCYNALWLLQLDFQLCALFVPLLLLFLRAGGSRRAWWGFYAAQALLVGVALAAGAWAEGEGESLASYFFLREYYGWSVKPWVRCGGFLVGYNLGIFYLGFKRQHQKQKLWTVRVLQKRAVRITLPALGVLGLALVAYSFDCLSTLSLSRAHLVYFGMLRTLVPLLVVLIILPSLMGFSSFVKMATESWLCNLVSKLSLSLYGVHYILALFLVYYRQSDLELSNFTIIFLACCTLFPAALLAVLLTALIQIPVFVCKKIYAKTPRITYFEH